MEHEKRFAQLTRGEIYSEIWSITASGFAKKHSLSYPLFLAKCKEEGIPIPASGYWTRYRLGLQVEQPALSGDPNKVIYLSTLSERTKIQRSQLYSPNKKLVQETSEKSDVKDLTLRKATTEDTDTDDTDPNSRSTDGEATTYPAIMVKTEYNRNELYKAVWERPATEVAKEYGVSSVALSKICRSMNIPIPYRGYWAEVRAGKEASIPELPIFDGAETKPVGGSREFQFQIQEVIIPNDSEHLAFLSEQEKKQILTACRSISLPTPDMQPLRKITAYKPKILEWNKKHGKEDMSPKGPKDFSEKPPFLAGVISEESLPRVFRILDAIFRQVEILGGKVNSDLRMTIRGEDVVITIVENQDTLPHVITKKEAELKLRYIDDKRRRYAYGREPIFRKYDYVFNGKLRITVHKSRHYRDSEKEKVEDRLGDILIDIFEESEVVRIARIAAEEEAREKELRRQEEEKRRREEERIREEKREKYNKEIKKVRALANEAEDYDIACKIRAYITAVSGESDMDDITRNWVLWATQKADWFDPTIAREDEALGVREHSDDPEHKELKPSYGYFRW